MCRAWPLRTENYWCVLRDTISIEAPISTPDKEEMKDLEHVYVAAIEGEIRHGKVMRSPRGLLFGMRFVFV